MKYSNEIYLKKFFVTACIVVFITVLSSCGSEEKATAPGPQKTVSTQNKANVDDARVVDKKEGMPPKESKKQENQSEKQNEYSYDATGKPDPFEPLIAAVEPSQSAKTASVPRTISEKPLTPLQRFDLADLFLVAIVSGNSTTATALIEDNARNGYIVKEGMLIGRNDGVIKKILKDSLIVEEKITDSTGKSETKITTLTIHKKD